MEHSPNRPYSGPQNNPQQILKMRILTRMFSDHNKLIISKTEKSGKYTNNLEMK